MDFQRKISLREKCPYSELFWSVFSLIRTKYGEIRSISPYAVRMRENADQNNAKYRQFSPSVSLQIMGFYFELGKFLLKSITQGITKFTYDVTFTNDAYLQHLQMMPKPSKTL